MTIRHGWLGSVALLAALALGGCEEKQVEVRQLPDLEGGNMPEYGAGAPEVEVSPKPPAQ